MKLYGIAPTRALRPIWVLNELDLDCEIVPVDIPNGEHHGEAFRALNPFAKVPVLADGDFTIRESAAIPLYLAEKYGDGRLIPTDLRQRAEMHQWIFSLVAELEQPLWRMALHGMIYPDKERSASEVELARRDCAQSLKPFADHLADRTWLVGDAPSVADFIAAFTLDWVDEEGLLAAHPALVRYVDRLDARPTAPPRIPEAFAVLNGGGLPPRYRRDLPALAA